MADPQNPNPRRAWEARLSEAAARVEQELRSMLKTIDDEVVPEVRKQGASALRTLSTRMQQMAQHLDDSVPASGPGKPAGSGEPPVGTGEPPHERT